MFRRLMAATTCLVILLVANVAYILIVVPRIDPPLARSISTPVIWESSPSVNQQALERLFPPDAWQLDSPKSIESDHAILLFQKYKPGDGELLLTPCTIVVFSGSEQQGTRRPYILQSPQGVIIRSDDILGLTQSRSGMISAGRMLGSVSIHSPETQPGKGDAVRINTRNVQIDRQRIWTANDVEFQLGPHRGRGRDLVINLSDIDNLGGRVEQGIAAGQIDSMELIHVEELQLQVSANPLDLDNSLSKETDGEPLLLNVVCDGPLRFDFQQLQLSLEDNVQLSIERPGKEPDHLTCLRLELSFSRPVHQHVDTPAEPQNSAPPLAATSALTPRKLVATGNPAILQSPSSAAIVRGRELSYEFTNRNLVIDDPHQSSVIYGTNQIIARSIAYQLPLDKTDLGQLHAEGAGSFKRTISDNRTFLASWKEHCHLQRHDEEHVLSLKGEAVVSFGKQQRIGSDQLHIWLKQVPVAGRQAATGTFPLLAGPTGGQPPLLWDNNSTASQERLEIRPVKMAAIGNVTLDSSQLTVRTSRAEIWVRHVSQADLPATAAALRSRGALTFSPPGDRELSTPASTFSVSGDLIRAQMLDYGEQLVLNDVTIQGNVTVKQLADAGVSARPPLLIHGDSLQMQRAANGLATIEVKGNGPQGKPAWVSISSFELSGPAIRLDQRSNQIQVDGGGQLTMHPAENSQPRQAARQVTWKEKLLFDGSSAHLIGDVESRIQHQFEDGRSLDLVIMSGELEIKLSRRLDLANPRSAVPLDLSQLIFSGDVFLQNRIRDKQGRDLTADQLQVGRLVINQQTGQILGEGTGRVSSVFRRNQTAEPGRDPPPVEPATGKTELSNIQVHFDNGFTGDFRKRIIRFLGRVRSVYGPVDNWEENLNLEKLGKPGPGGAELHCEQLTVADLSVIGSKGVELEAVGNTYIEARSYVALAHRLTFSQAKEMLVLEGGRQDARLWLENNRTPTPNAAAQRITYQLRTRRVEVNGASILNLNRLPPQKP
jgi:lipopolysaccharide export system protein LptA